MGSPALEVRALAKRYRTGWLGGTRWVLREIELVLAPGEALGLVGPNGSGKSTLLRILAGVERASEGSVRIFGTDVSAPAARARIGYVPDGFPFPLELGPRAVLELLGSLHGEGRRERRAAASALLERVGLAREARTPLGRFSLGMQRRFALCQALAFRPDLLLLDEPTAGLDAPGYVVLDECLREARARGATLLIATHVLGDLQEQCERAAVLVGGRIAHSGATAELLRERGQLLALYRELAARS
jgi:ABC-type multidrug transport system ATPase subunit